MIGVQLSHQSSPEEFPEDAAILAACVVIAESANQPILRAWVISNAHDPGTAVMSIDLALFIEEVEAVTREIRPRYGMQRQCLQRLVDART